VKGKNEFYPIVRQSLNSKGYKYFDGDQEIKGKTASHRSKPDYIATKSGIVIIGEIKSPDEPPKSGSWRQIQPNDSTDFAKVREDVKRREKSGQLNPGVGGHEIIIKGQIPDYVSKIGKTFDLPINTPCNVIKGGYTIPSNQSENAEKALQNCGKNNFDKIDTGSGSITYIFDL
jgi:hypothetical protein